MNKKYVLFIVLGLCSCMCYSKDITIYGTVRDTTGEPLAYADIVVKGSNLKIMADVNGDYKYTVRRGSKVTYLWCNYKWYKTRVWKSGKIDVCLCPPKEES